MEGKSNLLRLRQEIPLSDEELAAVGDGVEAMNRLLERLADKPTPEGPTPRQIFAAGSDPPLLRLPGPHC
jgi:hypothetical protein